MPHQLEIASNGIYGSGRANLQAHGALTVGELQMLGSGPQQPTATSDARAAVGGSDILVPDSAASSAQPQMAELPGGVDSSVGDQHYTGAVSEYQHRESGSRPTCPSAMPVEGRIAAISRALSITLDPTCGGSATTCAWCNRPALVTGPAGSTIVRLFDEVRTLANL